MMSEGGPMVSVFMVTYNHEKFIRQSLQSVIDQKTTFQIEVIIGEDCSTDGTKIIIEEFEKLYPEIMKPIYHTTNVGGLRNAYEFCYPLLKGKYIACLEGDDYWTDDYKLQKQIEFLEENPDFAICFHNSKIIYDEEPGKILYSNSQDQAEVSTFEDLAKGEFIYTPTCIFRNDDFKKFPKKFQVYLNNYTLDLHNAQFGKIMYINEIMSTYRVHRGGIWSMVPREKTLITQLPAYKFYLNYFDNKYKKYFTTHLKNMTSELIFIKLKNKDFKNFWVYYIDYVFYNFRDRKEMKRMGYIFLKANYYSIVNLLYKKLIRK